MSDCRAEQQVKRANGTTKRFRYDSKSEGRTACHLHQHDAAPFNDFYNEIIDTPGVIDTVYKSWLRSDGDIICHQLLDQSKSYLIEQPHRHAQREELHDEIKSLTAQLSQVKRRLQPAAQTCFDAGHASSCHAAFIKARAACNPMECLGLGQHDGLNSMFVNRSAIKLANINATMNFALIPSDCQVFSFVDLCGAPGGFSEYLLDQAQAQNISCTMGYGMSLMGSNENGKGLDWKIQEGAWMEQGMYSKYTICHGADGRGDVFQWDNVVVLRNMIRGDSFNPSIPEAACVQLVVADGGIDAQREQDNQEEITQKLVVCQMTAALELLTQHGIVVIKVFGFQTAVIRSMMQDLSSRFESIRIVKPISSRPASAERYVVFFNFHGKSTSWHAQEWQNGVLLGHSITSQLSLDLDKIDRDMLQLNLQACFAILTRLETQRGQEQTEDDTLRWVRVNNYRQAWRLA
ncbi:hypothetical protein MPSEU_000497800 [Mayamaea pseudoterrestris]|nr:hypothetical protein MPSEU_000497800 [Mayamaea pseudoterrestris]